jgi:hypothetical protein
MFAMTHTKIVAKQNTVHAFFCNHKNNQQTFCNDTHKILENTHND